MPPRSAAPETRGPGRPPGGGGRAKVLTAAELRRVDKDLTDTPNELRNRALLSLQYTTGLRVGELASLNVGDVLRHGKIRRQFHMGTEDTKYCRPRAIRIESSKAAAALLAYLRERQRDLKFNAREPLFIGKRRNEREGSFRLSANSLADLFRQIYQRAGIVGASSHSGRRWFMAELARSGVDPRVIQERLGHSALATTQQYIKVAFEPDRRPLQAAG